MCDQASSLLSIFLLQAALILRHFIMQFFSSLWEDGKDISEGFFPLKDGKHQKRKEGEHLCMSYRAAIN